MQSPGPLSGVSLRSLCAKANASFLATSQNLGQRVLQLASALHRPLNTFPDVAETLRVRQEVEHAGVIVSPAGAVCFTPEAQAQYLESPWSADASPSDLFQQPVYRADTSGMQLPSGNREHAQNRSVFRTPCTLRVKTPVLVVFPWSPDLNLHVYQQRILIFHNKLWSFALGKDTWKEAMESELEMHSYKGYPYELPYMLHSIVHF